jgi:phosphoglycolate phosphatase-like HAD superfamily hydrolase
LIIFDVDGTLTRSTALDARLYAEAFVEVYAAALPSTDWDRYANVTDRGIAEEAAAALGLPADRLGALERRFVALLEAALAAAPVAEVPGAGAMLRRLRADGHRLALATGCWAASARAKLAAAGIDVAGLPLVGCDDHAARTAIVAAAARAAPPGERVISVGDGVWDVRAAARLGLSFVGVDCERSGRLAALGGFPIVPDYRDADPFLDALAAATVPRPI